MSGTSQTPIYSPHPAEPRDPARVIAAAQCRKKELKASLSYPSLPWTLEDLPSTTWCHVQGRLPMRIDRIGTNEEGKPIPIPADEIIRPGEFLPELGCWWNDRFCIKYWVRVDHLPPTVQFEWVRTEIAHRRGWAMLVCLDWFTRKHAEEEAAVALRLARAFAEQHGLPLPPDLLPVRTFPRPGAPGEAPPRESDVHLAGSDLWHYTYDSLLAQLSTASDNIVLDVACPSVNELYLPAMQKGAQEYLLALYIGETIAVNLSLRMPVQQNRKRPEQSYGFWRSCVGNAPGVEIYMSPMGN